MARGRVQLEIIWCHRLKGRLGVEDELASFPDVAWTETMCIAMNRCLHNSIKRHHRLRIAVLALDFARGRPD